MKISDHQWLGPFEVKASHRDSAYALALPAHMKISNIFKVPRRRKCLDKQAHPPMDIRVENDDVKEVKEILNCRKFKKTV